MEEIDLRHLCRDSDKAYCLVMLEDDDGNWKTWLRLGVVTLTERPGNAWSLDARMGRGATDFEHDSAYVCCLPLIGVAFSAVYNHMVCLDAWINPEHEDSRSRILNPAFAVPLADYNPLEHPATKMCNSKRCETSHPIVSGDMYMPPFVGKLFLAVRGKRVRIRIGTVREK